VFAEAARLAAPGLEQRAVGPPPVVYLTEARHLAPEFRLTLSVVAHNARPRPQPSAALSAQRLKPVRPRLGDFDASLRWGERSAYGELKCGPNEAAMEACAWDALKCAFALRHGFGEAMFLLACAPQPLCQQSARGCELFAGGEWQAADLRARYAPGFTKWERDGYKPVRVPTRLRTVPGARVPVNVNGAPWLLALARVEPIGDLQRDRYGWPPLMTKAEL
jgi:hypothetical protein